MDRNPSKPLRYRAFISYSHSDALWADWLHRQLEGYRVPARLRGSDGQFGPLPDRLIPIFRDREELASAGELGPKIHAALSDSEALIVICSPAAAASKWVNEEILAFKRLANVDRIYCLIVAGEPHAGGDRECFPPALRFAMNADGGLGTIPTELVAADLRPGKDGKSLALLKILSGLLGVELDSLRQREAQRRHRRLLVVTASAVAITLLTSLLAVQAVIARHDAERRQKQAENLVGFMLGDLNDKLAQVQRLDIMESVDDQAMKYFESLPTTDVTDEALAQRVKALEKIGSVRLDQGHLPEAMEAYRAALPLAAALAEAKPTDTPRQLDRARIQAYIGMAHWYQGQLEEAGSSFDSAKVILERARARDEKDPRPAAQLADIHNNVGHILETRGRLDQALGQYRSMLQISEELVAANPDSGDWTVKLGLAHNNLGKLALTRGDLATAIAEYEADDRLESALSKKNSKDNNQLEKVAITRATLGRTQAMAGDIDAGIDNLRQAVDLAARLRAIDPTNTSFQEDYALYASQLSRLLRLRGELPAATALNSQAIYLLLAMTKQDPANASWQRELAEVEVERAEQLRASGNVDAARVLAQSSLTRIDPLLVQQSDDRATLLVAVGARLQLAAVGSDAQVARQLRDKALEIVQSTKGGKDDPRLLILQVDALLTLGRNVEAQPIIQQLFDSGCRDPALVALLKRERVEAPIDSERKATMQAVSNKRNGR